MQVFKNKIALVTDTSCDLPQELIEKFKIFLLPLKIIYPEKEYDDRLEITPEEIYQRFPDEIPTTSMVTRADSIKLLDSLKEQGYTKVIAIFIARGLSGTYDAFKALKSEYPEMDIHVIDSNALSLGLGYIVLEGARLLEKNLDFEEVVSKLRQLPDKIKVFFSVPVLDYLKKGGRIGYVTATIGSLIDLKPIISINQEGKYFSYAKTRGRKKSISKLVEIIEQLTKGKKINLAVMHGKAETEALGLKKYFENATNIKELFFGQISPVLVVHTGPGLVGLVYQILD